MSKKASRPSANTHTASKPATPPKRGWIGLLIVLLVVAGGLGYWFSRSRTPEAVAVPSLGGSGKAAGANVVLITMDFVRADSVGCYSAGAGGDQATSATPGLDSIAAEGVRFTDAVTVVPIVLPSHTSLLTGQFPHPPGRGHGVRVQALYSIRPEHTTLAEVLESNGYDTAAFIGSFALTNKHGLHQGFDVYDQELPPVQPSKIGDSVPIKPADQVADAAISWIRGRAGAEPVETDPFFVWINFADAQTPFNPPAPFSEVHRDQPYRGEVAFIDAQVSRVVDAIKEAGAWDNTLFIATSPCGQSLGEHGNQAASMSLYESSIAVPLIIRAPKLFDRPRVVDDRVAATIDIFPTVIDALGIVTDAPYAGLSLLGKEVTGDRGVYVETFAPRYDRGWSELYALRRLKEKIIDAPAPEYYDLSSDPTERTNQYSQASGPAATLKDELARTMIEMDVIKSVAQPGFPGPETRDPKELGPKDPRPRIVELMGQGKWSDAEAHCNTWLSRYPEDAAILELAGRCQEEAGRNEPAYLSYSRASGLQRFDRHWANVARIYSKLGDMERFEQTLTFMGGIDPHDGAVSIMLGEAARKDGQFDRALTEFRNARTIDPVRQTVPSLTQEALTHAAINDGDAASKAFDQALKIDPDYVPALEGLADTAMDRSDWQAAVPPLQHLCDQHPHDVRFFNKLAQCLKGQHLDDDAVFVLTTYSLNNPNDPAGFGNLGNILYQLGQFEEAVYNYRKALELSPNYLFARFNLANTLEYQDDTDQAIAEYRQVFEQNPQFGDVVVRLLKLYAKRSDYDAAFADLESAAVRSPVNWTAIEAEPELHLLVEEDRYKALRAKYGEPSSTVK